MPILFKTRQKLCSESSLTTRFLKNRDGVAAIEFAFIAPIMIFMYFGLVEMASAISTDRKIAHSANVAGDLATQSASVTPNDMAEIMSATIKVMSLPSSKLGEVRMEISSYSRDSNDVPVLEGRATLNGPFPVSPVFDPSTLDQRILSQTSGIVVARVSYNYEPFKLQYFDSDFELRETFFLKPRKSANVAIDDGTGQTTYTCSLTGTTASCTAS